MLSPLMYLVLGRKRTSLIPISAGVIGIFYQLVINRGEHFAKLGFGTSVPRMYLEGLLAVCGILLAVSVAGCWTGRLSMREGIKGRLGVKGHPGVKLPVSLLLPVGVLLNLPVNWVVAIFTEELVFRGLVQRQLTQSMQPLAAILVASCVFGIWHRFIGHLAFGFDPRRLCLYILNTGLLGVVFGVFYFESGSLLVSGFVHAVWNSIVYTVWGVGQEIQGLLVAGRKGFTHPEHGILASGILGAAVALLSALAL